MKICLIPLLQSIHDRKGLLTPHIGAFPSQLIVVVNNNIVVGDGIIIGVKAKT